MDMGDALRLPETELAHAALEWARGIEPEYLLNHSVRSYLFGRAARPDQEYDDELLFLATRGLSEERPEIVWDAIALHTSIGIANRKRPEIALANAGIGIEPASPGGLVTA
jgi:hypothetical protein